ncbi:glycosyltransferase family 2 protein [Ructibacterium gallinarum]|uniref:Glycosyltransferase family 2 protein n=1 Tax=Ructibacterium gallinarum TaxID=2779355 RepID=A0A9D5M4X4_9FIRM|nr:glycosyltransferase family 2 protein [Ructibacterium gallinarum]MBE5039604.1 glycosyltransferase family 2 protein [Ructibacterium gallinarum]
MDGNVTGILADVLCFLFFLLAVYYFGIAVFSLFPFRLGNPKEGYTRFAVVIPAHNEETVLRSLLHSLRQQDYPQQYFSIIVIADRCIDATAKIARQMGASVLIRNEDIEIGKGVALRDAFEQILKEKQQFDAVVVLDADNLLDCRFLSEMNFALRQGNQAVQGYIDAKNPNASWVSYAYATWYWITNRILQMGFWHLGIGCSLGGTGFALSIDLLRTIPWQTVSVAEDAEYTLKLALENVKIAYAAKAVVFDEKPDTFKVSVRQRCRWAQGITAVQRDYMGSLLRYGKWNALLRFWSDLMMPLCFCLCLVLDFFAICNLLQITNAAFADFWARPLPFVLLNFYIFGMLFTTGCGLILDKKCHHKLILNFFGFMIYIFSWIPAGLFGILRHTKKDWYHTVHKHNV